MSSRPTAWIPSVLRKKLRYEQVLKRLAAIVNWHAEGDIMGGGTVTTVSDAKVVLNKQTDRIEIELYPEKQKP